MDNSFWTELKPHFWPKTTQLNPEFPTGLKSWIETYSTAMGNAYYCKPYKMYKHALYAATVSYITQL